MPPTFRAQLSASFEAKRSRIRRLPQIIEELVNAKLKMDAVNVIEVFQDGITRNNFRLEPLKPKTIARKIQQGMKKPRSPLYGKGEEENNSYINMWYIVKTKFGFRVRPRSAKHWSGRIKLKDLWDVHEHGKTIRTKHGIIEIPDRPAWEKAQQRFLKQKYEHESEQEVKKAIKDVIRTGRTRAVRKYLSMVNQAGRKHERGR